MACATATVTHTLIGKSPRICWIRDQIVKFANSRSPILLLGETGVGKEVVARAIYEANPHGDFVPIDCGSMVGSLMESELFGHEKGSFTSASHQRKGLIEQANGGTAFFDEVGDLPIELQVKLLRVLQEREYRPVGSTARHKVDLRVVAATNRDLSREVEKGTFRSDLFYRLNVIRIVIPPLRDRKEDIPLLMKHFLKVKGNRHTVSQEVMRVVLDYDWPGNVRELWNTIQQMTTFNSGPILNLPDMPTALQNHYQSMEAKSMAATVAGAAVEIYPTNGNGLTNGKSNGHSHIHRSPEQPGVLTLSEMERRHITEVLRFTNGDRTTAALLLGIGRTTLYRKMKCYEIQA